MGDNDELYKSKVVLKFDLKKANQFFPHILLVGLGIGTANFIMNGDLNWIQWTIQSLSTSLLIGYTLVVIGLNKSWLKFKIRPIWKLYVFVFLAFVLVGVFAIEVEHIIRSLVFHSEQYQPFSGKKMYLFNGIISLVLGLAFFQNQSSDKLKDQKNLQNQKDQAKVTFQSGDPVSSIPVKQGENILLIPIQDIVYFEAYDNYSFVYDLNAEKRLCDYSLLFLEKRLDERFSRVHRKYIVNARFIKQIRPHLNGRYLIEFSSKGLLPITSSKSYSMTIRKLIKIE